MDLPIRKLSAFAAPTGGLPPAMSAAASLPAVPTLDTPGSIARKVSDGLRLGWGKSEKVVVSNTGHGTMQVNFGPGNTAVLDGRDLELLQFHFHTPSEHAVNGVRFPMEVHFVHRDKSTGGLAVLGVMMEGGGKENKTFGLALRYAPEAPGARADCPIPLDSSLLLPSAAQPANSIVAGLNSILDTPAYFVHYPGSLTTPPCSEKVQWYVMLDTIKVSDSQILNFMKYVGAGKTYSQNSRPVQPINGRPFEVL